MTHQTDPKSLEMLKRALKLKALKEGKAEKSSNLKSAIAIADRSQAIPLSWSQQRLWFLDQLDHAAGAAYHIPAGLHLSGDLDRSALQRTLDRIVARHEVLRTSFPMENGVPVQRIAPRDVGMSLHEHDLQTLPGPARQEAVSQLAAEEARAPFDLAQGPLIRARLVQLSAQHHILLLTQHHIISDGWSTGVLVKEMSTLYSAFRQGQSDPLPPLPIQYADYAVWQRSWLQGAVLASQLDFWKHRLQGAPSLLELPCDHPRPPVQSYRGSHVRFTLPADLTTGLRQLSQRHGATLFMTLLAGWSVLLSRLSNQQDVVIGTPVANRPRRELEPLAGFFVNTLALRVQLSAEPTVATLLAQIKADTLSAYDHQDLPFEQVVEALQPPRSLSHSPLFQVMLAMNNTPGGTALDLAGLHISGIEQASTTAHFDLTLSLSEEGELLQGSLEYASDLFDQSTVERISAYLGTVLTGMVADDSQRVSHLPLLSAAQRHQVINGFNATATDYPHNKLIHQLFEEQANRQPDATALVYEDQQLSYHELNARANQLAHHLLGLGVKPDDRVAICMERSLEVVVGLLGILKAGGAYVPLDPNYPQDRLAYMLADSEPVLLLTQSHLQATLPAFAATIVMSDIQGPAHNPDLHQSGLTSRHLSYVIYTSGSTGQPKGVMNQHGSLCNLTRAQASTFAITQNSRVLQFASFSFDASVSEWAMALCHGAALYLVEKEGLYPGKPLADTLQRYQITHVTLPSSALQSCSEESLSTVTNLIVAGEACPPALARQYAGRHRFFNAYGPTETTVCATIYQCGTETGSTVPIGKPIANTQIYILDTQGQPVPVGVSGEIFIGGAGVARGYLNRPELTAERFIPDPFSAIPARLYKTGDLGRWLNDGNIEYLGRNDYQVKIRGFRIELGEIEVALTQYAGVREAVVIAREDQPGDKRLVAYLTAHDGAEPTAAELRTHLAATLAEYMIPSAFVVLDSFPLTPNGKLDRKALPAPDASAVITRAYEAPAGEVEIAIALIWQELLNLPRIGRHDHFFELGGHSLLAVQMMTRLRQSLGVELALRDLFAQPVLAALAQTISGTNRVTQLAIVAADRNQVLPLSWSQQRLWFLDQLDHAAGAAYHLPAALQLTGELDKSALQRTLDRIVARHEVLRTSFPMENGVPVQRIAPRDVGMSLHEHDLQTLPGPARQEAVSQLAAEEARAPFDLAQGPLIRARLVQLSAQHHILLLTQHHIISDGWSTGVLVKEMSTLYSAFRQGQSDPLPPLPIQYADYAVWQRSWLQGAVLASQLDFWKHRLQGAPSLLELPCDHPRPPVQSYRGSHVRFTLPADLTTGLRQLSQRHGATLFMTLLAGWSVLLSRLSNQQDVVIGTPVANRPRRELEPLAGFFVNTLALRVQLSGEPTVATLLAQIKADTLSAYDHQDLPFEQVVEALQPPRSLSHSPLFQVMLAMNNTPGGTALDLAGLHISGIEQASTTAHFDLTLSLSEEGDLLQGSLEYASDLFDQSTVERMSAYLGTVLSGMVADDSQQVNRLPLLSAAQRYQVINGFNATATDYPHNKLIHQLFEEQANRQPDATALVYEDQQLSYHELNARANQLAHHLIGLGVKPDDRVAICMERSLEMVVGLLGILKAGGAYVPLDPNYPQDRLAYMLADSAPTILLTQTQLQKNLSATDVRLLVLNDDNYRRNSNHFSDTNIAPTALGLQASHAAYVIYTSGSTGQPKGVINQHSGVVNRLLWAQDEYCLTRHDCVLQKTPFGFDVSVWEFFLPLLAGAQLVLAKPGGHQDPAYLIDLIERKNITTLHFVPSMLQAFLSHVRAENCCSLKRVLCSGEALPFTLQEAFRDRFPDIGLHNLYGPTEAAIDVTYLRCADNPYRGIVPIGKPIANTQIYILDSYGQPVPVGVSGELYIGGAGVARGYLNRPELTAERFVPDPFSAIPARMYKTGDLGRWLNDGNIEYLGRNDYQVKIRGFRIELGEIEVALTQYAGVREAVVTAREDQPGDKRLVAYLTAQDGAEPTAGELRNHLSSTLAEYMIPAAFVVLDSFPLTPNGKLDRKALPAPDSGSVITRAYEAPAGEVEIAIALIWQELLNLPRIGRHDHFFELGGHSLMVVTLIERLRRLNLLIDVRSVFIAPTLSAMAAAISTTQQSKVVSAAVPANLIPADSTRITPAMLPLVSLTQPEIDAIAASIPLGAANIQDIYPLAPLQEGILFHHLLETAGDAYLSRSVLAFRQRTRLDAFLAALQLVINRHDILRSAICWQDLAQPVQVVCRQAQLTITELTLQTDAAALDQLLSHTDPHHLRIDLKRAPLMCAYVAQDGATGEWLLALLTHHLIVDHVSLELIVAEVQTILLGRADSLPPSLPYRDFIVRVMQVPRTVHETYFREQLADVDEPTAPFGLLRMQEEAALLSESQLDLSPVMARRIRATARRHGVTPAVLFHVAWAMVLARCSARDDVVFGTVLLGRSQGSAGADQVVGMFINTLPLRIQLAGQSVQQVVAATFRSLTELLAHEQASLSLAQQCSGIQAPLPLFSSLLNYRHSAGPVAGPADTDQHVWEGMRAVHSEERTNYPLVMSVDDLGEGFALSMQCVAALDAARMNGYLHQAMAGLVEALSQNGSQSVGSVTILPDEERRQILTGFNATAADYAQHKLIHQLFEEQAERNPDAVALLYENQHLSYGELNQRANQLAHHLTGLGVQPDDRVAICAERNLGMIVGLLGILKSGGAYVPLDPAYPAERLAFMLKDCAPVVLLTQDTLTDTLRDTLPALSVPRVVLDEQGSNPVLITQPVHNPQLQQHAGNLAYVIYTSGSTGLPKGVMVEHRNVAHLVQAQNQINKTTANDRVLQFASFSFDASVVEIFPTLCAGAALVLRSRHLMVPDTEFIDFLHHNRITLADLPTAFWHQWAQEVSFGRNLPNPELRSIAVGGEKAERRHLKEWLAIVGTKNCDWMNTYGPTETTVHVTTNRFTADRLLTGENIAIGRPIANTQIYILDTQGQPVPVGVSGEIFIGGAGVARGYLNRPDLTAERFIPDPFSAAPARMYKTGDLGRWLSDGNIEYLGRNDYQVKIRGFRIELGEIEVALTQYAGVREAVVTAREDQPGDKRLVAYLTAQDGAEPTAAELRNHLSSTLAEYMIPSAFVVLDAFPLTPNGKLDRKALPAPDASAVITRAYEAPAGEVEIAIALIWQELLNLPRIGRHDHFFELGGHSLLAVQMMTRLRQSLGVELALRDLFAQPVLAALAQTIAGINRVTQLAIVAADRNQVLPLSWSQQRLWFLDQLDHAAGAAYHLPAALQLTGELDRSALQRTLDRIVARHEVLRTSFPMENGVPVQRIAAPDAGMPLHNHDLNNLTGASQQQEVNRLAAEEAQAPFDLSQGPLIRARLVQLSAQHHILLLTQHHIISDGWSTGVLVKEMSTLYSAFRQGQSDPLPPLPIQYADYAVWQRSWLQGAVLASQLDFWKHRLQGAPSLLELPCDHPRPPVQSYRGSHVRFTLPADLTTGLRQLSQRHGATLFMTLLAGWSVLLSRLSNQQDVVIGTPVANRPRRELEPLAGFFVNTLALRVQLSAEPTVATLLAQIKADTLSAYDHQDLPFEQVVEALQPPRSLSHSPLFQVMLAMNNTPGGTALDLAGLHISGIEQASTTAHFDLTLSLSEEGELLQGSLEYASDLFDRTTIERISAYLGTVLSGMVADDSQRVSHLPLLSAAQRQQVVTEFNATATDYPDNKLIHQLFEEQAHRQADATALIYEDTSLSYGELNARANQLAHHLIGLGVKPDDRVAICMERSLEMVVGLLGILKAGGAYLPLDPNYPQDRLAYMLADSEPVLLLTQSHLQAALPAFAATLVMSDIQGPAHNPDLNQSGLTSRHLAYVMYTSGSTGHPKGVLTEHRNVVRLVINNHYAPLTEADCVAHCANVAFDASTWEIWSALLHGARVLVVPQSVLLDPAKFSDTLIRGSTTAMWLTSGLFNDYADTLQTAFGQLRYLLIGGDVLDPHTVARVMTGANPPVHVINGYGPTESTTFAATCAIPPAEGNIRPIPIGKPIANTQIYILDSYGQPVPVGVSGELYIGGAGVARGYLNRPELTAERFVADPFSAAPARLYKTGDLGRWLNDGNIEYLGRNDYQVKIRGFRIELGEIEVALTQYAGVREAVVIAREDQPGDKRLVAYLTAQNGAVPTAAELRTHLAATLAEYMIPSAFVVLDSFPLTPNGKLDRKALPAPDASAVITRAYEAPAGEVEIAIALIWQELLNLPRIGRHDHFFELGGHSLLAVQMMTRLRQSLGVELALRDLFAQPVLAALAQTIAGTSRVTQRTIGPADRNQVLPLSWSQQRLWFLDQLDHAAGAAYHLPAALQLKGDLDRSALQRTLDRIVARHEVLRTSFPMENGVPVQRIAAPDAGMTLHEHDLQTLPEPARQEAVSQLAAEEAQAPFDLAQGPLIRARLVQLSAQHHILLLTQHHIISDGWSTGVLVKEMSTLYSAFRQGQSDPLPPLPIQYADYAVWQRNWLQGAVLESQLDFWKHRLQGAPSLLELPADHPRPPVQSYRGSHVRFTLPAELTSGLRQLSQRHGATLFMTLLAGWSVLLSRLSNQQDVVIGTPVANRPRRELEPLAGFFVNTLALRVQLSDEPTVAALLAQIKADTLSAYDHQDLPFEQVVEALQPPRSLSHSPLFQVMLAMNNTPGGTALDLAGLHISGIEQASTTAHFDLTLSLSEEGDLLQGSLEYASDLFDRTTIERISAYLGTVLSGMVADDSQRVSHLPLLSAAQRHQVINDFNATATDYPHNKLIHQLFEEQAHRQPDATAVVYEDQQLSYHELNARANQLAHHLIGLGVKPDDRVAICMERSLEMVVGLLGILKAGGAYVPLDPGYPQERLAYMLADSEPVLLLTQSHWQAALPAFAATIVMSDTQGPAHNPDVNTIGLCADHLAYVIYTSGSTGQPKGVMNQHGSLCNLTRAQASTFAITQNSRVLQFASFSFDASVSEWAMALCHGAALYLVEKEGLYPGKPLADTLQRYQITHVTLPSSALQSCSEESLSTVTNLIVAGEACPPALARQFAGRHRFFNAYGPTETTVCATIYQCGTETSSTVPIGRPIANTQIYILDTQGQPVPVGVSGELYIGGAGVARGYLNRPELTAERFIPDPFSAAPARMYKTGDLGRWLNDGNIEYLGRNDYQVKIRGFRIELGEIEVALTQYAGVREAVVTAREDQPGDKRLVAYLTARDGAEPTAAELRTHLAATLAEYMIPSAFVVLDSFPLTPNGKLDRKALPAPDASAVITRAYEAPAGEVEIAIAVIWQELLNLPRIGRHDHFFELGGHSLMVVTLIERLRRQNLLIDVRSVFIAPTLSAMAAAISTTQQSKVVSAAVPANLIPADSTRITPAMLPLVSLTQPEIDAIAASIPLGAANIQDIYPLAPLQEGILFHHLLETAGDAYLSRSVLAFRQRTRLDAFLAALQLVINRHDILRSAICWQDLAQPVQVVCRQAQLTITELTLQADAAALDQLLSHTDPHHLRIDLKRAPLMCAYVAQDGATGEWLLALLTHHLIVDHVSLELIVAEVQTILLGRADSLPPSLPYRDFIVRVMQVPRTVHETYFREQLADVDEPTAPFGLLRMQEEAALLSESQLDLSPVMARRIRATARRHGVTPAVLFHVAWAMVLARCSARDDVVFGTVLLGRSQGSAGADQVVGMFINTLPLRIQLTGQSVQQVVAATFRSLTELLAHEQASLSLAQQCSGIQAPLPLFSSLLNYRHSAGPVAGPADTAQHVWDGMRAVHSEERTNYPLVMSVDDLGEGFALSMQCVAALDAARMNGYLHQAMAGLVAALSQNGSQSVGSVTILPDEERRQILTGFNATAADYAQHKLIHQLFEEQAERNPDAVALLYENQHLSYGELNQRANQLAHHLTGLGVQPDDRVAICAERNLGMIVGLLGILKSGGAYVPLDPAYPAERLAFMLKDCAPVVLLTQDTLTDTLRDTQRSTLPALSVPRVVLDEQGSNPVLITQPVHNPQLQQHAGNLAYVIYTSGSTGLPKGVMVEHRNVINFLMSMAESPGMDASTTCLALTTMSFDIFGLELYLPLSRGARVVLSNQHDNADAQALSHLVERHAVDFIQATPASWQILLDSGWKPTRPIKALCGGDSLPLALARRLESSVAALWNMYGPTETTIWSVNSRFDSREDNQRNVIGRPISNTQIYILDTQGQPVPVGVPGEIYIGGAGVARGYLNRPELTAERFVPDPFSAAPARMYKTGDLGLWLNDGNIEYLGRNDYQVKIRGFRIELGEIEVALTNCAGVREAIVIARQDQSGDKRLVAYLTARTGATIVSAALRMQLSGTLAEYMIPSAFVVLESLPLTPNGKLNRAALPAPDTASVIARDYEAPLGDVEMAIATIWKTLLDLPRIGRHDHFFELGGHSLLAIQMIARLTKRLGIEIPLRQLFANPTVSSLARNLAFASPTNVQSSLTVIRPDGGQTPLFLIHEVTGEVGYMHTIAAWIHADIPVYGFVAQGLMQGETPLASVNEMAAHYLLEMRQVQPVGPYRIAGWSAGGTIAYEMARQLIAVDSTVEFLGLIDTQFDYGRNETENTLIFDEVSELLGLLPNNAPDHIRGELKLLADARDFETMLARMQACNFIPGEFNSEFVRRRLILMHSISNAIYEYSPSTLPVNLTLFSALGESRRDLSIGWDAVMKNDRLQIVPVSGTHTSIMEDLHIKDLGFALSESIADAKEFGRDQPELFYVPRVVIQNGAANTAPLFCVPGAGASVASFNDLSRVLPAILPLHGFQARGLDGKLVPHGDVESAARAYVDALRKAQPQGPYRLLGHSFGGWIAFEMAQQLVRQGQTVSHLIIIDSEEFDDRQRRSKSVNRIVTLRRLIELYDMRLPAPIPLTDNDFVGKTADAQINLLHAALISAGVFHPATPSLVLSGVVRVMEANLASCYTPAEIYLGPIFFINASENSDGTQQQCLESWQRFAPNFSYLTMPGNHMTMLSLPLVAALGDWLTQYLATSVEFDRIA